MDDMDLMDDMDRILGLELKGTNTTDTTGWQVVYKFVVAVSTNNGASFNIRATTLSGSGYGYAIPPGTNHHIIWEAGNDIPGVYMLHTRVKVSVNDSRPPADMVQIPAGSFTMGDTFNESFDENDLPVHTVYVSDFYIDKYEVTNEKMRQVMQWAYNNGKISATTLSIKNTEGMQKELMDLDESYCQFNFANGVFTIDSGKEQYPCQEVTWYGALAYCKYKNEIEGKEQTINLADWSVDWNKYGYRLPTEAEWEKAARGGMDGMRFSWSDTNIITHSRANYYSTAPWSYDVSPTTGYHPDYITETTPFTSPVGSFAPNGYGLYDMSGNVVEWCWDWYSSSYYSSSPEHDPRGPASGSFHVWRGGSWQGGPSQARCAYRDNEISANGSFRCACR